MGLGAARDIPEAEREGCGPRAGSENGWARCAQPATLGSAHLPVTPATGLGPHHADRVPTSPDVARRATSRARPTGDGEQQLGIQDSAPGGGWELEVAAWLVGGSGLNFKAAHWPEWSPELAQG